MRRAEAPLGAPPLVILPGFGNCSADYEAPEGDQEASIAGALRVWRLALILCRAAPLHVLQCRLHSMHCHDQEHAAQGEAGNDQQHAARLRQEVLGKGADIAQPGLCCSAAAGACM